MIAIFSRVCCCVKSDIRTMWSWTLNKIIGPMRNGWFRWKKVSSRIATEADVKIISALSCPPRFHPSRCAAQRSGRRFSPLATKSKSHSKWVVSESHGWGRSHLICLCVAQAGNRHVDQSGSANSKIYRLEICRFSSEGKSLIFDGRA